LGDPVASDEERVEPFKAQRGRPGLRVGGASRDPLDSTTEVVHHIASAVLDLAGPADVRDVLEDILQGVRIQGHDFGRSRQATAGWSHSGETPTRASPRPRVKQISVAAGRRDTIRMRSRLVGPGPLKRIVQVDSWDASRMDEPIVVDLDFGAAERKEKSGRFT